MDDAYATDWAHSTPCALVDLRVFVSERCVGGRGALRRRPAVRRAGARTSADRGGSSEYSNVNFEG